MSTVRTRSLSLAAVVALAACGGGGDAAPAASGSSASAASTPVAQASFDPASITPAMIALGDSIFHGKIGASSCQACHGAGGKAGAAAPDLTDGEWLHSDGSYEGIANTIKAGVMSPKQFSSVMPPYGGVMLPDDRWRAVAAYVYSVSHK
ncbi:c-type cytochrome [Pseudogemmatithrix spongiicola]|uniref:C-type cytochrome n=1 Tax=Pseudogemmatithrix spongiicola TaxID=3062599 RepID=A0AA49Q8E2_9BACT|nr:c-type cytochrome [Gemmatimonadaceae bacterium 'strain 138']WKW15701.1 c-type cytochrome [Gemmatimonadaceae bacterium 'strain 318']